MRQASAAWLFLTYQPADGDPRRTYPAKQRLQMVDPGHDHARDVHGRAGRDGSQRRAAGHHVGFRHRHLDGRMGHHRLHDHHDPSCSPRRVGSPTRFGNKRIYILGLALFTLGSWLCGKAPGDLFLIGARALQGVGSGIIQSLGLAIVTREFRPEQRGLALGLWAMAAAASISFGPLLGGYLVDAYSWHRIFDVNVPVGVFAILLSAFIQKEWKAGAAPVRLAGIRGHRAFFMPLAI